MPMLVRGSVLLLLGWWLRRRMMSFVFFHLFRLPVGLAVLVLRFQSRRHWPVHFDFKCSLTLASQGWRLVPLRLGESAWRLGLLRQAPVLLSLPSL